VYDTAWKLTHAPREPRWIAQLAMTKNFATRAMGFCADEAVQTLRGAGFIRGTRRERIYREVKVMQIGGGAEEIMKDLAARQLGGADEESRLHRTGLEHHPEPYSIQQGARAEARIDGREGAEARLRHAAGARRQRAPRNLAWRRHSAVLDATGGFAIMLALAKEPKSGEKLSFPNMATIDLRVDYLRPGRGKHFVASAKVVRLGTGSRSRIWNS
jgi:hypothetical protein